jgi:diguanylate cyclase (GGDEF)-like protein
MKNSIKKVFDNLFVNMLFILLFSFLSIVMIFDATLSISKTDNLIKQKSTLSRLTKIETQDHDLALIRYNSLSAQLRNDTQKLQNIRKYNFVEDLILKDTTEYNNDLLELSKLQGVFNQNVYSYLFENTNTTDNNTSDNNTSNMLEGNLQAAYAAISTHIDRMLIKDISYKSEKFLFTQIITVLLFLLILTFTFTYRIQLNKIYKDILFLYSVEGSHKKHTIVYDEMDAIALRMKRKSITVDETLMVDKTTGLFNKDGLMYVYKNKKSFKEDNPFSITIFEIDNFSPGNKQLSQETMQTMLQKIAYTFSLYEKPTDVIARTAYGQFTLLIVRDTKKELFEEMKKIHENISELKFKVPDVGSVNVTLSGGFVAKPANMHFNDAVKIAEKALTLAKETGGNKLFQERDVQMREHE